MDSDTLGDTICCLIVLAWFCTIFISVKLFIGISIGAIVMTVALLILLEWPVMFIFLCSLCSLCFVCMTVWRLIA
jgi:hypothetical protein